MYAVLTPTGDCAHFLSRQHEYKFKKGSKVHALWLSPNKSFVRGMASIQYARDRKHTKTLGDFIVEAVYTNDKFSDAKLEVKFINGTFVSIPDGCKEFIVTSQGVSHPLAPLPGVEHSDEGIVPIVPIEPIEQDDTTSNDEEANDYEKLSHNLTLELKELCNIMARIPLPAREISSNHQEKIYVLNVLEGVLSPLQQTAVGHTISIY